jgi:hypothetical protein
LSFQAIKHVILFFSIFVSQWVSGAEPVHTLAGLSEKTRIQISKSFRTSKIVWDDSLKIKIDVKERIILENYTAIGYRVFQTKFRHRNLNSNTELIGIYLDGNTDPMVALIQPGKSYFNGAPAIWAKADKECANYKVIVVLKIDEKVIANKKAIRVIAGDC